jgi:hypothetical protein
MSMSTHTVPIAIIVIVKTTGKGKEAAEVISLSSVEDKSPLL